MWPFSPKCAPKRIGHGAETNFALRLSRIENAPPRPCILRLLLHDPIHTFAFTVTPACMPAGCARANGWDGT